MKKQKPKPKAKPKRLTKDRPILMRVTGPVLAMLQKMAAEDMIPVTAWARRAVIRALMAEARKRGVRKVPLRGNSSTFSRSSETANGAA